MGIFDYFFSHAKQKQDKPIRDNLNSAALFLVRYFYILK